MSVMPGFTLGYINRPRVLAALPPATADMPDPALMKAGSDWPAYGGSYSARRFSPLTQITPDNVGQLERAWLVHTGDLPSARAEGTYGEETLGRASFRERGCQYV